VAGFARGCSKSLMVTCPGPEASDWLARRAKRMMFDRIEWRIMPDAGKAQRRHCKMARLTGGSSRSRDLIPLLKAQTAM